MNLSSLIFYRIVWEPKRFTSSHIFHSLSVLWTLRWKSVKRGMLKVYTRKLGLALLKVYNFSCYSMLLLNSNARTMSWKCTFVFYSSICTTHDLLFENVWQKQKEKHLSSNLKRNIKVHWCTIILTTWEWFFYYRGNNCLLLIRRFIRDHILQSLLSLKTSYNCKKIFNL